MSKNRYRRRSAEKKRSSHARLWALPFLAAAPLVACSGAPQPTADEATAKTRSALEPTDLAGPVTYTIKVNRIHVNQATEPTVPTSESCAETPWTNDTTGFQDVAQLGVAVNDSTRPKTAVFNGGQPATVPCNLGPAPANSDFQDSHLSSDPSTAPGLCPKGGAFNQALAGKDLSIEFSVNPPETVSMAFALDNVESGNVDTLTNKVTDSVASAATVVKDGSDVLKLAAPLIGFGAKAAYTAAVVSTLTETVVPVVGIAAAAVGVIGDFLAAQGSTTTTLTCSANEEASYASSCAGGLLGPPLLASAACQGPNAPDACKLAPWTCTPVEELTLCGYGPLLLNDAYLSAPLDTLLIMDPATNQQFTSDRLLQVTASGAATYKFSPSYDMGTYTPSASPYSPLGHYSGIPVVSNVDTADPWLIQGCQSSVDVYVTIQREWDAGGPAAAAKSGDFAVVSNPGRVDAIGEDQYSAQATFPNDAWNRLVHYSGWTGPDGSTFQSELDSAGAYVEATGVNPSTEPVVVSRDTGLPAGTTLAPPVNLDVFWADSNGALNTIYEDAKSNNDAWQVQQIIAPTAVRSGQYYPGVCSWQATNVPPNALVTATARTPNNLDAFFVGNDGNVYNAYWSAGAGVNAQGQRNWGVTPITTKGCAPNEACAGSGVPGGSVAVLARNPNSLDVFYVGSDNGLWWASFSDGATNDGTEQAHDWYVKEILPPSSNLPLALLETSAHLTAAAPTSQEMDVFWMGLDGGLWRTTWQMADPNWTLPTEAEGSAHVGAAGGAVSAVARGQYYLDVLFAGENGELEWASAQGSPAAVDSTLTNWPLLQTSTIAGAGSVGSGGVSIVAPTSSSLQGFYFDGAHDMHSLSWSPSTSWTIPASLQAPPAVYTQGPPVYLPECAPLPPPPPRCNTGYVFCARTNSCVPQKLCLVQPDQPPAPAPIR